MADLNRSSMSQLWQHDDSEDPLGTDMDDDELFFDDEDLGEEPIELSADIPSWRRIEMAREDQHLKEAMADFEDYDDFEDYGQEFSAEFSH